MATSGGDARVLTRPNRQASVLSTGSTAGGRAPRTRARTESVVGEVYSSVRMSLVELLGTDVPDVRTREFWVNLAQILLYVAIFIFGLMVCLPLGILTRDFNQKCVLYSHMKLQVLGNGSLLLDTGTGSATRWGDIQQCYFCTFSGAFACIFAIVWFWFFVLCAEKQQPGADPNSSPTDLKLLVPTLVATLAMTICMLVVACEVSAGFDQWCSSIRDNNNGMHCSATASYMWINVQNGERTYSHLQVATAGAWLLFLSLITSLGYTGYRLMTYAAVTEKEKHPPNMSHHVEEAAGYVNPNYDNILNSEAPTPSKPDMAEAATEERKRKSSYGSTLTTVAEVNDAKEAPTKVVSSVVDEESRSRNSGTKETTQITLSPEKDVPSESHDVANTQPPNPVLPRDNSDVGKPPFTEIQDKPRCPSTRAPDPNIARPRPRPTEPKTPPAVIVMQTLTPSQSAHGGTASEGQAAQDHAP